MKFQVEGLNVGIEDMIILGFTWIKAGILEEGIGQWESNRKVNNKDLISSYKVKKYLDNLVVDVVLCFLNYQLW